MSNVEIKIEAQLEGASDVVPVWSGFVDSKEIEYDELRDGVSFNAFSADDLASRFPAELVSTQFVNPNVDGGGTDGLVLHGLTSVYVTNANVSSYPLNVGTHTLSYEWNSGTPRMKLDNGAWVTLANGSNTLGDGATAALDAQRVTVYVEDTGDNEDDVECEIIVATEGTTLPNLWYRNVTAKYLLQQFYDQIGIETVTFDTMEMGTYDSLPRVLKMEIPPNDPGKNWTVSSMTTDGTDMFISLDRLVYKRNNETGVYTYLGINPTSSNGEIKRMWYNARNNHLWIYYYTDGRIRRLNLADNSWSAEVIIGTAFAATWQFSMELIDYNYTGSTYKYGMVYTDANSFKIRFVNGSSLTDTDITPSLDTGYVVASKFLFLKTSSKVWFKSYDSGGPTYSFYEMEVNGSGTFVSNGKLLTNVGSYTLAAYDSGDDRVYHYDSGANIVKSHTTLDATSINHLTTAAMTGNMIVGSNGVAYFGTTTGKLYSITGTDAAVQIGSGVVVDSGQATLSYVDRLYGIDNESGQTQKFFTCHSTLKFFVPVATMSGLSVRDAINKILNAFNLVGILSSAKKAFVYRRCNDSGTPQTTGNTLSITLGDASELVEVTQHVPAADLVRVTNGTTTVSYNGTKFNADVLSNKFVVEINSDFIPDDLVKDLAFLAFQFFSVARNLYKISLGAMPLWQYEPFDNCSVNFDGRIKKVASGPIYATILQPNGTVDIEVLL